MNKPKEKLLENICLCLSDKRIEDAKLALSSFAGSEKEYEVFEYAIKHNNFELLEFCIENKFDVNVKFTEDKDNVQLFDGDMSPILCAALYGNVQAFKFLEKCGADVYHKTYFGDNVFMLACSHSNNLELIEYIADNYDFDVYEKNKHNVDAFGQAVFSADLKTVKLLKTRYVKFDVNNREENKFTPIMWAVLRNDVDLIEYLIGCNARINFFTDTGFSPLSFALFNNREESFRKLIECGADVNLVLKKGDSLLMRAVSGNKTWAVKCLLENGANVNYENKRHQTALDIVDDCLKKRRESGKQDEAVQLQEIKTLIVNNNGLSAKQLANGK